MTRYRFCILCAALAAATALFVVLAAANDGYAADARPVSFIDDVAPIIKERCYACHDTKKKSGKLEMTSYAALRRGGDNGDPVQPGKPSESELYDVLVTEGKRKMPPPDKAQPLPAAMVGVIERWIAEGAKLDEGVEPQADLLREVRRRWQPPAAPETYPAATPISAVAFSPDGSRLATSGYYEVNIWDAKSGQLLQRLRTRTERAYALVYLADKSLAVAGGRPGDEGDVRIYDVSSTAARLDGVHDAKVLAAHLLDTDDSVLCLAVSKDGKKLAAGGADRLARVWDLGDGATAARLEHTIGVHADWVQGVAFAFDGRVLLTASRDKTAKSFDLKKQTPLVNFADHQAPVHAVGARADGKIAYSVGADKTLRLWKPDGDGRSLRTLGGHTDEVVRLAVFPTKSGLATLSLDRSLRLWREDGTGIRTISRVIDNPTALAISPDGTTAAVGGLNGQVKIVRLPVGDGLLTFIAAPGVQPD